MLRLKAFLWVKPFNWNIETTNNYFKISNFADSIVIFSLTQCSDSQTDSVKLTLGSKIE